MKIDYAIVSSDNNSLYLDFWPYVSYIWKIKFDIEPVLLYIGEDSTNIQEEYGKVIKVNPSKEYPIHIQSLFVRYWYACSVDNKISIISDIDMFPISKKYFTDSIKDIDDSKYIHLNPCINQYGMIPSCYHVARGDIFREVLGIDCSFEDSLNMVEKNDRSKKENCPEYWFSDEIFATNRINNYKNKNIFEFIFRDGGQNGHRIDRGRWKYDVNLFKSDHYWDSHVIRPFKDNKEEIEKLFNLIIRS
jgi:hypothetical protein